MGNPLPSTSVPTLEELGLPEEVREFVDRQEGGVIFFSGLTATGKTTSVTATANYINENQHKKIVTLEDPIEFIYQNDKSFFLQREFLTHYSDLSKQLEKTMLRDSPDVIILNEVRYPKELWLALKAAQWDTLVLVSLLQESAASCLERIIDMEFDTDGLESVGSMMESVPTLIVQHIPRKGETGRTISYETLTPNEGYDT